MDSVVYCILRYQKRLTVKTAHKKTYSSITVFMLETFSEARHTESRSYANCNRKVCYLSLRSSDEYIKT